MQRGITLICLIFVCVSVKVSGQEARSKEKRRAVIVPPDIVLTVIAPQADCPLQLTKAMHVGYLDGGGGGTYQLLNRGSKPIRTYTVAELTSAGTGNVVERRHAEGARGALLLPGQTAPQPGEETEIEIVPLTDELRDKLKLRGSMKAVAVFMIVRIEFGDGTVYSDEQTFKALQAYFAVVGAKVDIN